MEQYRHQPPHRLSGGQLQKVALAGALAMKPKYLILDEACSMLDPQSREKVWESVETLHRDHGIAVISITHFPEEVFLRQWHRIDGKRQNGGNIVAIQVKGLDFTYQPRHHL